MLLGDGALLRQGKDHHIDSQFQVRFVFAFALPEGTVPLVGIHRHQSVAEENALQVIHRTAEIAPGQFLASRGRPIVKVEKYVVERMLVGDGDKAGVAPQSLLKHVPQRGFGRAVLQLGPVVVGYQKAAVVQVLAQIVNFVLGQLKRAAGGDVHKGSFEQILGVDKHLVDDPGLNASVLVDGPHQLGNRALPRGLEDAAPSQPQVHEALDVALVGRILNDHAPVLAGVNGVQIEEFRLHVNAPFRLLQTGHFNGFELRDAHHAKAHALGTHAGDKVVAATGATPTPARDSLVQLTTQAAEAAHHSGRLIPLHRYNGSALGDNLLFKGEFPAQLGGRNQQRRIQFLPFEADDHLFLGLFNGSKVPGDKDQVQH